MLLATILLDLTEGWNGSNLNLDPRFVVERLAPVASMTTTIDSAPAPFDTMLAFVKIRG